MFGFVVVFSFLWVVWALSPLSTPLIGPIDNPLPDMLLVLCIAALAIVFAARIHRAQLFARRIGSRLGAWAAMALFALSVYPPFTYSAFEMFSDPADAPQWFVITPRLMANLLDAYSLPGVILAVTSTVWLTAMLLRHPRHGSAE